MLCEGEPSQLLAKILDHVAALKFTMDQHIQPQLLLDTNRANNLVAYESLVRSSIALPLFPFGANRTHFLGLGKRTNGCRRKKWELQSRGLALAALCIRTMAARHCRIDASEALLNSRVVNSWRRAPAFDGGPALLENVFNFLYSSVRSQRASALISCNFCLAKASQPLSPGSSSFSRSRSTGTCSSEQEGPTMTRSCPR